MAKHAAPIESLLRASRDLELSGIDTSATPGWTDGKDAGVARLAKRSAKLGSLQENLYANSLSGGTRSVLLVIQGMDTSGKGGIIGHALAGVDLHGVHVHGFKAPTPEELTHDFLWRVRAQLPGPGVLGVFDRSHYEDVVVPRVRNLAPAKLIETRYGVIDAFEAELAEAGTEVVKVFLHISKEEQKARLEARLDRDDKHWKFNPHDVDDRMLWPAFQDAWEVALRRTTTDAAPWYVVPADHKWYARLAVQSILIDRFAAMGLTWPQPDFDLAEQRTRLAAT